MTFAVYFKLPDAPVWGWTLHASWREPEAAQTSARSLGRLGFDTAIHDQDERLVFERKGGA